MIPGRTVGVTSRRMLPLVPLIAVLLASCSSPSILQRSTNPQINRVLEVAESLLGTSYCAQGASPECFDCSGFTTWCFMHASVALPRSSREQFKSGTSLPVSPTVGAESPAWIDLHLLRPGDLVFFVTFGSDVSHVGIYTGDDHFAHASTTKGVMISSMQETYWRTRFAGARRILNE